MALMNNRTLDRLSAPVPPRLLADTQRELLRRAEMLLPQDRMLVELSIKNGLSRRQLSGIVHRDGGTITRRLQRLAARLHDPLVIALLEPACPLPAEHRQLGVEHFLQGQTMRQLSDRHRMSLQDVRGALQYIRGWHCGVRARGFKIP